MENIEMECRKLAKQKEVIIRKKDNQITLYYTVTIRRQSKTFYAWEEVFKFLNRFNSI